MEVKKCPKCGAKVTQTSVYRRGRRVKKLKQSTIFHGLSCEYSQPGGEAKASEAMPGVSHGSYVAGF